MAGSLGSASVSRPRATARRYSPVPPARIATPPAAAIRARTPRACVAKSATLNGSSGSTRSRPWCGTRARSAAVALAVPMSRPRKTCRESAEMIVGGPAARRDRLGERDRQPVLPVAVAPGDDDERRARRSRADERAPQRVRAGVVDADRDLATDERLVTRRDGRACCRASGRTGGPRVAPVPTRRRRGRGRAAGATASTRTSTSRPSQAWLRSRPIASWTASSSFRRRRLTSAGTSSARRVAGVPGRGE